MVRAKDPNSRWRGRAGARNTVELYASEPLELPPRPGDREWPQVTRDWYAVWCKRGLSMSFDEAQWHYLLSTALVHADFWDGNTNLADKLRAREKALGALVDDLYRLNASVTVVPLSDRPVDAEVVEDEPREITSPGTKRAGDGRMIVPQSVYEQLVKQFGEGEAERSAVVEQN